MTVFVDIDPSTDKHIQIEAEYRFKELCKSLPGSRWDQKGNVWRVPLSWSSCLALRSTFRDHLDIGPNLTDWATNHLNTKINPTLALREAVEGDGDEDLFLIKEQEWRFLLRQDEHC